MSEFSLSALKNTLSKTKSTPTETEILGTKIYLHRLTTAELIDHEDVFIEAQTSGNARMASGLSVQVVIDSLVHPGGSPVKTRGKPTAEELLVVRDDVVFLDAIDRVKEHAIGRLGAAEKN